MQILRIYLIKKNFINIEESPTSCWKYQKPSRLLISIPTFSIHIDTSIDIFYDSPFTKKKSSFVFNLFMSTK